MEMEILRGELERLFSLDELTALSRDLLGFDPQEVGGTAAKASFARALTDLCSEVEAVGALVEAVVATRTEADPRLRDAATALFEAKEDLATGSVVGPFTVGRKIGEGGVGVVYQAKQDGRDVVLKVLRREASRDRRALHRFFTATRLAARVDHEGLPKQLAAGSVADGRHHYVSYEFVDGQPLSSRIARTGPMHFNEARTILRAIADAVAALHDQHVTHGDLKLENVILARAGDGTHKVMVADAGTDRLRLHVSGAAGQPDVIASLGSPKTIAPEQVRGKAADVKSDVYALGAIVYEVLTGKPVHTGPTGVDVALAHLTKEPAAPSSAAPRGWITPELDTLVLSLLHKDPTKRPKDARAVLEALEIFGRQAAKRAAPALTDAEVDARIDALVAAPEDDAAAMKLEAAVEEGADAAKVAEAFAMSADEIEVGEDPAKKELKKSLLFRAARIYENVKNQEKAEQIYGWIVDLDPTDDIALIALEEIRKALGKYEEVIEMLLGRSEAATSRTERARAMAEIGRIYATELDDKGQALVAYSQAFCEDAQNSDYAEEVERAAGTDMNLWGEAISTCAAATQGELPSEVKNIIFERLGRWYADKVQRPDAALTCFQAIVATDPANDGALVGMGNIYKKAQQWPELGAVLLRRADAAATPARARDLRAEAADLLETKLNDNARARDLFQQIVDEDPSHAKATEALARILERTGDFAGFVKILERRAEALRGEEKASALARIAEVYEDQLNDLGEAVRRYETIIGLDEKNLVALKGLDRIYSRTGKYHELLAVLDRQVAAAATPRQKITLFERIAAVHDEEFLDHKKSAEACESILLIDPAHDSALTALARHYRALDRWEDVATVYEKHMKVATDDKRRLELLLASGRVLAEQIGSPERAMKAYDRVLELDPHHAGALEALAHLREAAGDATAALEAIEALAAKAATPKEKAEQWTRAAKILESRGDKDGAIARLKLALDANPKDAGARGALRAAFTARGDASAAIELIAKEIEIVEGDLQKARLYAEMAKLAKDRLKDDERARSAAKQANDLDPTNIDALVVLGDLAFEGERFLEAASHLEGLATRTEAMDKPTATRVLVRYVDSLAKTGSTEKAVAAVDSLLAIAPDDADAIGRVAKVTFLHGEPKRSWELHKMLLEKFGERLLGTEKAEALYRLGESARRAGDLEAALGPLSEAADIDPALVDPPVALAKLYEAKGEWESVVKVKNRRLDVVSGEERYQLLLDVGEILSSKLGDRTRAAKTYVAALEDRPDDRKLLTKLMQLYSEEKDWSKLVEVVLKLADFVDDKKQKSKYVHTAAIVTGRQMGDVDKALEYYDRVLELDPSNDKALDEAISLRQEKGDHQGTEKLLKVKLERANEAGDRDKMLETFQALAVLYHKSLGWISEAIDAYEAAQTLDPDDKDRNDLLAELYASDPAQYLEKAVHAQRAILRRNPYKPEAYKLLRRLYTEAKRADSAWCLCQALFTLNLAEPDEERFFKRMRSETAAPAQDRLGDDDWSSFLMHEDADPVLTSIFALIEPAIIGARAQPLEALGYDPRYAIDLSMHPYPMSQTLYYASGVLGMAPPPTFQNPNDMGGLSFLHAHHPSIVLGRAALEADVPTQAAAFIAARHLTYYRPGMYVRHLVPTGTGLKAWLFAAIKMIAPQFPVSADLEGPVKENLASLGAAIVGPTRERLASLVSKLLQGGGSLDLKKWVAAVDLTADRAGFIVAHDLEVSSEIIKASGEDASAVPIKERIKELVLFGVSESYFSVRDRLAVGIDA